ncbi:MAG: hypothetical protein AAF704_07985 [Cyanobacteria bacterium P01_D01_bin.123]
MAKQPNQKPQPLKESEYVRGSLEGIVSVSHLRWEPEKQTRFDCLSCY